MKIVRSGLVGFYVLYSLLSAPNKQLYSQLEITQEHMVYFLIHVIYICQLISLY